MVQALQERVEAIDQQIAALQSQKSTVQAHQAWLRNPLRQQPSRSSSAARQTRSGAATTPARPWPRVRGPAAASPSPRDRTTPSPGDNHHDCSTDTPVQRYRVPPTPSHDGSLERHGAGHAHGPHAGAALCACRARAGGGGDTGERGLQLSPRSVAGHGRVCGGRLCGGGRGRQCVAARLDQCHGGHHTENCGPRAGRMPAGARPCGGCGAPAHRLCGRCVGGGCRGAGAAVRHAARHGAQHRHRRPTPAPGLSAAAVPVRLSGAVSARPPPALRALARSAPC